MKIQVFSFAFMASTNFVKSVYVLSKILFLKYTFFVFKKKKKYCPATIKEKNNLCCFSMIKSPTNNSLMAVQIHQ